MVRKKFFVLTQLLFLSFLYSQEIDRQFLLDKSIVSTENNYRLKKVIDKIKNNEKVYIAAVGGSITEGEGPADFKDGYAYQFFKKLKLQFTSNNGKNLYFNGAGLCGTPSVLGLIRYKKDVEDVFGKKPDLVILEFAVNDSSSNNYKRSYEALIKDILSADENTAVISLYSAAPNGNFQNQMKIISDYYKVPQVSILNLVNKAYEKKYFTKNDFYADYIHPNYFGHELMADALINLLKTIDRQPYNNKFEIPEKCLIEPSFSNMKMLLENDENVKIDKGDFNQTDIKVQHYFKNRKIAFENNFYHPSVNGNRSFKVTLKCKNFILYYKCQSAKEIEKFGKAKVYVDGVLIKEIDGEPVGSWNNPLFSIIIDEKSSALHTIEIQPEPGKGFTILTIGYSE